MSIIALPRRHGKQKPRAGGTRIDWQQSLSKCLVFAGFCNEYGSPNLVDVVQGSVGTMGGTSPTWASDGLLFAGGTSYVDFGASSQYKPAKLTATVIVALTPASFGLIFGNEAAGPLGFQIRTFNAMGIVLNGCVNGNTSTGLVATTAPIVFTLTWDGTSQVNYWTPLDGSAVTQSNSVASTLTYGTSNLRMGTDTIGGSAFGGTLYAAYLHNRVLTAGEVARLHAEPYVIATPPPMSRFQVRGSRVGTFSVTNSFLGESGTRGGARIAAVTVVVEPTLLTQTASRSAMSYPRPVTEPMFGESVPGGHALAAVNATETLITESVTRVPLAFVRSVIEPVVLSSASRSGPVAPVGTHFIPLTMTEALLTESASHGAITFGARAATNPLITTAAKAGPLGLALRSATNTLFSSRGAASPVAPALGPGAVNNNDPFAFMASFLNALKGILVGRMINNARLQAILDKAAASYRVNELTQTVNLVSAIPTLIVGQDGISGTIYGTGDEKFVLMMAAVSDALAVNYNPDTVNGNNWTPFLTALDSYFAKYAAPNSTLNLYLTAANTATPYTLLVHPNLAYLYFLKSNKQGSLLLSPANVFAPQTTIGSCTVGAGAGVVNFTHLTAIPTVNNPGATPPLQGYTPAPGLSASITTTINGVLTVTVTANGWNSVGGVVTGRTWTATLTSLTAGASVSFTPTIAGDRIADITGVAGAGAATAGAFNLVSILERVVS